MDYFDIFCLITIIITDIIVIFGLLGNLLSFLVFSRKAFRKSSINVYCRALAIFDCFTAIVLIFNTGSDTDGLGFLLSVKTNIGCKIFLYITVAFSTVSGWILVMFSIDQILNVSNSQRLEMFKKKHVQIGMILTVALVHVLLYLVIPIRLTIIDSPISGTNLTTPLCSVNNMPLTRLFQIIYLIECILVPFVIMMLTTVYILRVLNSSMRRLSVFESKSMRSIAMKSKYKQRKFALNSVALNILFIALTCPLVIGFMISSGNVLVDILIQRSMFMLFLLNYSIHFATHFIVNSVFRRQFFKMIIYLKPKKFKTIFLCFNNH